MSDSEEDAPRKTLLLHLRQTSIPSAPSGQRRRDFEELPAVKKVKKCLTIKKGKPKEVSNRREHPPDSKKKKRKKEAANRDPRFSSTAGNLDVVMFSKAYEFLDEYRQNEKSVLKNAGVTGAKEALERMEQQDKRRVKLGKLMDLKHQLHKQEKEKIKEGKTPYFFSDADVKKRLKREEFESIKGDKDKFLSKRRKKAAGKEKKLLPARRNVAESWNHWIS